jgi:hypothetical protein
MPIDEPSSLEEVLERVRSDLTGELPARYPTEVELHAPVQRVSRGTVEVDPAKDAVLREHLAATVELRQPGPDRGGS